VSFQISVGISNGASRRLRSQPIVTDQLSRSKHKSADRDRRGDRDVLVQGKPTSLLQHQMLANVAVGSFSTELGFQSDVRFTPVSDRIADIT